MEPYEFLGNTEAVQDVTSLELEYSELRALPSDNALVKQFHSELLVLRVSDVAAQLLSCAEKFTWSTESYCLVSDPKSLAALIFAPLVVEWIARPEDATVNTVSVSDVLELDVELSMLERVTANKARLTNTHTVVAAYATPGDVITLQNRSVTVFVGTQCNILTPSAAMVTALNARGRGFAATTRGVLKLYSPSPVISLFTH